MSNRSVSCLDLEVDDRPQRLSFLQGTIDPPLVDLTLGGLLELQSYQYGTQECLVIPWTGARWTYNELHQKSSSLARCLLAMKIQIGDRIGIMAGNCEQYAAVFFAAAKVGAMLVILNNTYTATEAMYAIEFSECKVFFTTKSIGRVNNSELLDSIARKRSQTRVVILRGESAGYQILDDLITTGDYRNQADLHQRMSHVLPHQVVNLQFTSGTTGLPKAAMLTHQYVAP